MELKIFDKSSEIEKCFDFFKKCYAIDLMPSLLQSLNWPCANLKFKLVKNLYLLIRWFQEKHHN